MYYSSNPTQKQKTLEDNGMKWMLEVRWGQLNSNHPVHGTLLLPKYKRDNRQIGIR